MSVAVGWRAWRRDADGLLWPPFPQGDAAEWMPGKLSTVAWRPGVRNTAVCYRRWVPNERTMRAEPHPDQVPAERCTCGIRVMPDRDALVMYCRRVRRRLSDPSGRGIVVGEVAYGGDVYPGGMGDAVGALRVTWAVLIAEPELLLWSGPTRDFVAVVG
jgi:hypothetical protein